MTNPPPSFAPRERRERPDESSLADAKWVGPVLRNHPRDKAVRRAARQPSEKSTNPRPTSTHKHQEKPSTPTSKRHHYRTQTPPQRLSMRDRSGPSYRADRPHPSYENTNNSHVQPPTPVRIAPKRYSQQANPTNYRAHRNTRETNTPRPQPSAIPTRNPQHAVRQNPTLQSTPRTQGTLGAATRPNGPSRRPVKRLIGLAIIALMLLWPLGLLAWASSKIQHVDALSNGTTTAGTTYLIAGSDKRDGGPIQDDTEGQRSDTIMVLHKADNGQAALVSIPRDSWVDIPGYGQSKINAAYAYGGPPLLVETVEELTGLHVDHYVEVGMGGVTRVVDALGEVNLCLDYDVNDPKSELVWQAGCHDADGATALAFARMRYCDPEGDIGRARRQREVVSAVINKATSPTNALNPATQMSLASAAASSLTTDPGTGVWSLVMMGLGLRSASNAELTGAPPISSINLETTAGSAVELDPQRSPEFFTKLREGNLTKSDFNQAP